MSGRDRTELALGPAAAGAAALTLGVGALAPLFEGLAWVPVVVATIVVITVAGVAARAVRAPLPLVVAAQLAALAALVTALFTDGAALGPEPGPLRQVQTLLAGAGEQIRTEAVPVAATPELTVLLVLLVGAAAVAVDGLVVGVGAPAGAGLVLLCLVAVPASLVDELLPWWAFALGAAALVVLLAADGTRRSEHAGPAAGPRGLRSPLVVVAVAGAVTLAGVAGSWGVWVGTEGRLASGNGSSGVGLNPFTQLRGQLDQPDDVPLFTVSGLEQGQYLRSVSLDQFIDEQGWVVSGVQDTTPVPGPLRVDPVAPERVVGMTVQPAAYVDRWLPVAGEPVEVRGDSAELQPYSYDDEADAVHSDESRPLPVYSVRSVIPGGGAEDLRAAEPPGVGQDGAPDARYYATAGIDPAVADLATELAGDAPTTLDAAVALTQYFTDPANGFTYDLATAENPDVGSSDALVDFLTVGRQGFCEQFSSSMAAMLRTLGIPSRVAVGFTATSGSPQERVVTTSDAHAWVEVFFPGQGWVVFDPTPLTDGRGLVPEYVQDAVANPPGQDAPSTTTAPAPTTPAPTAAPVPTAAPGAADAAQDNAGNGAAPWPRRLALPALGVALLGALVAAPAVLRAARRRARVHAGTASAAWAELEDLSLDRGIRVARGDTPRRAGRRAVERLGLDSDGAAAVAELVQAVESDWYGAGEEKDPGSAVLARVVSGVERARPLRWRARLLPPSLRRERSAAEDEPADHQRITAGRSDA